jgi:hypothetical protein
MKKHFNIVNGNQHPDHTPNHAAYNGGLRFLAQKEICIHSEAFACGRCPFGWMPGNPVNTGFFYTCAKCCVACVSQNDI